MEARYKVRLAELLEACEVSAEMYKGMEERLATFAEPFAALLWRTEQKEHARKYIRGLLSDVKRKNAESIAYRHDEERRGLQNFVGTSPWDFQPLLAELARQVGERLGEDDGVIVFDPSAFEKCGTESVGVKRQWCGRLGKVENCQVGVFMGYATRKEHVLIDTRLYVPKEWTKDRKRRNKAGVPKALRFKTRHALALEMLAERGPLLPHAWITGDDEMGRSTWFRRQLRDLDEAYLLEVPSNTLVRDLEAPPPPYAGRGARPKVKFERADRWRARHDTSVWRRITVRPGEKGPLTLELIATPVRAKTEKQRVGPPEYLIVTRTCDSQGKVEHRYYLASRKATFVEWARAINAEHRVEEGIKRAKSEAGLADYEVRTWIGWYHHQTLSLIATWFLVLEAQRGKKGGAAGDRPAGSPGAGEAAA